MHIYIYTNCSAPSAADAARHTVRGIYKLFRNAYFTASRLWYIYLPDIFMYITYRYTQ